MRSELAAHLQTQLGNGTFVYDAGEDVIAVPAVIIFPSNPYMSVATQGPDKRINVGLEINLVTTRAEPADALNALEDMRFAVTEALRGFQPTVIWATFGNFSTTEIGGIEYATAAIDTIAMDTDRGAS